MDTSERSRLEKLLGMLGSSFDGERANAARMIAAMAEKHRISIVDLIYGRSPSSRPPRQPQASPRASARSQAKETIQALAEIARRSDELEFVLTAWECQFATDVSGRYSADYELSEKQLAVADRIIRKVDAYQQQSASA